jgi:hypothetical protein
MRFRNAEHNRSLYKEARAAARFRNTGALIWKAINSDQSSEAKGSILATHKVLTPEGTPRTTLDL